MPRPQPVRVHHLSDGTMLTLKEAREAMLKLIPVFDEHNRQVYRIVRPERFKKPSAAQTWQRSASEVARQLNIDERYWDRKVSREGYRRTREALINNQDRIEEIFWEQTKKLKKYTDCAIWNAKTLDGKLSLTSRGENGKPRFGLGKLADPPETHARRYIWNRHNPDKLIPKNQKIKMASTCHPHCVNPEHMYTNYGHTWA